MSIVFSIIILDFLEDVYPRQGGSRLLATPQPLVWLVNDFWGGRRDEVVLPERWAEGDDDEIKQEVAQEASKDVGSSRSDPAASNTIGEQEPDNGQEGLRKRTGVDGSVDHLY